MVFRVRCVCHVALLALALSIGGQAAAQDNGQADANAVTEALRILEKHDAEVRQSPEGKRRRAFLHPTPAATLDEATLRRVLDGGGESIQGIHVRDRAFTTPDRRPYFEGRLTRTYHPFTDRDVMSYAEGVYAVPGEAAYIGNFTYFPERDLGSGDRVRSVSTEGSFVFVGKRLTWDGRPANGMFIAENVIPGFALDFMPATPKYLRQFEKRHAKAVARQKRRLAGNSSGGGGFGTLLQIGLGAALIGTSDLSRMDKLDLAETFLTDVTSGGNGMAAFDQMLSKAGAGSAGTGVFSGNQVFDSPGLNQAIDGMLNQAINQ